MRNVFLHVAKTYNRLLNKYKYPTQILTGGVLWFAGDCLCQTLVHFSQNDQAHEISDENNINNDRQVDAKSVSFFKMDWRRVQMMTLYGMVVSAPVLGLWYTWLDKWVHDYFAHKHTSVVLPAWLQRRLLAESVDPLLKKQQVAAYSSASLISRTWNKVYNRWNPSRPLTLQDARSIHGSMRLWQIIGTKLAMDCFLFDPFYLTLFFTANGAMQGSSWPQIWQKLKADLPHTYAVDVAVWAPIQTINFRWIPVAYQALAVQACNIGWNAYLSYVQHGGH